MVTLSMTLSDLRPGFRGQDIFLSGISEKRRVLKTKLLLHKSKLNLTYGTVLFVTLIDLENASRGFVSISWASCYFSCDICTTKHYAAYKPTFNDDDNLTLTKPCCIGLFIRDVGLETWSWSRDRSRPLFWGLGLGLDPAGLGLGLGLSRLGLGLGGWSWARPDVMCLLSATNTCNVCKCNKLKKHTYVICLTSLRQLAL